MRDRPPSDRAVDDDLAARGTRTQPGPLARAEAGVAGPGTALPHGDTIQRAFGRHDVGGIGAHVGGDAAEAAQSIGAVAYATGTDVAFAAPPDLHTAAHEAAHVIQQRAGVARRAVDLGDAGDPAETHADAVADTVVRGGSAEALLDQFRGGGAPAVRRKITNGGTEYPTTWKQIAKKVTPTDASAAAAVLAEVRTAIGGAVNEDKLLAAWGKVAKAAEVYDVVKDREALVAEITARYQRSMAARRGYDARAGETAGLAQGLCDDDEHFEFQPSARNPMVVRDDMAAIPFDPSAPPEQRVATYASTVMLANFGGQEAQAALRRDGGGLSAATNENGTNDAMRVQLTVAEDLKQLAADLLKARGVGAMDRDTAMSDVVVRHALKLYQRLQRHVAADAPIDVPPSVRVDLDGTHAEIRIEQSDAWDASTHFPPSGTKYPCMGCYLYFAGQKIELGKWMGPLWVTNAALSQQLRDSLLAKLRIGSLGPAKVKAASSALAASFGALPDDARMGKGVIRGGDTTTDRNADSSSDLDDDEYDDVVKRAMARAGGKPLSPAWEWPARDDDDGALADNPPTTGASAKGPDASSKDSAAGDKPAAKPPARQAAPRLDIDALLMGVAMQENFLDTVAGSGLPEFATITNASGHGNNCLIFSLAGAMGQAMSPQRAAEIRRGITRGIVDNGYLTTLAIPEILAQLGAATVHVIATNARHVRGRFNAEVVGGGGNAIYLVNAADIHFGFCRPKDGVAVQADNTEASTGVRFTARAQPAVVPDAPPARGGIPSGLGEPPSSGGLGSLGSFGSFGSFGGFGGFGSATPMSGGFGATTSSAPRGPRSLEELEPHRIIRYLRWRDLEVYHLFLQEAGIVETAFGFYRQMAPVDTRSVAAYLIKTVSMDLGELLSVEAREGWKT